MLTEVLILEPKQKSLRQKEGRRLLQWQGPSPTLRLIHNRKGVSEWLTRSFNKYLVSYTCSLNRNDYKQPTQARISKTWLCSFQTKTRWKPARKKWKVLSVIDVCLGHRPGHPRKPYWRGWQCQSRWTLILSAAFSVVYAATHVKGSKDFKPQTKSPN